MERLGNDQIIQHKQPIDQEKEASNLPSRKPPRYDVTASPIQQKSNGQLPETVQAKMENSLGADFSNVNIHQNSSTAQELGALAYTQGNDVHFAPGQFNPGSKQGQELIGHELTHVVQQREGRVQANGEMGEGAVKVNNDPSLENEADTKGSMAARGEGDGAVQMKRRSFQPSLPEKQASNPPAFQLKLANGQNPTTSKNPFQLKSAEEEAPVAETKEEHALESIVEKEPELGKAIEAELVRAEDGGKTSELSQEQEGDHAIQQKAISGGQPVQFFFGKVWRGIKKLGKRIVAGIKSVGRYIGKVAKSAAAWVWNLIIKFPQRIGTLIHHLLSPAWEIPKWLWQGMKTAFSNPKGLGKWLLNGIKGGAAWVGKLFTKVVDVAGFGEMMDLVFNIVKFNTRTLSGGEIQEAKKVLGNSVPYWMVRIDEASLIAKIGAAFNGGGGMGVTTWHTINFNRKINPAPGNGDMEWLIHELVHVAQYEAVGTQYIGEALYAQATAGYSYGGVAGLAGKNLSDFNREQQGDVIADAYKAIYMKTLTSDQQRMIDQAKKGAF